jgi:NAD(P)-dependent dehydrogenase (short-subunit alcohol dehydrogenase family)
MIGELKGKVAFITGAAGGIGYGMARAFAQSGMRIVMADIDSEELKKSAAELAATGAEVHAVRLDVSDWKAYQAAADKIQSEFGTVQLLCNNAGISGMGLKVDNTPPELWNQIVNINLNGVYYGVHAFLPQMRAAGGGHIVNTASFAGLFGSGGMTPYVATKFAVVGLSENLRTDLEDDGIGVSVVCPGGVRTRLWRTSRRVWGLPDLETPPPGTISALPDSTDPFKLGLRIVEAVRQNEFYIIPHPYLRPAILQRHARLMEGFDRGEATQSMLQNE